MRKKKKKKKKSGEQLWRDAEIQRSESNISGGKTGEWATLIKVFT